MDINVTILVNFNNSSKSDYILSKTYARKSLAKAALLFCLNNRVFDYFSCIINMIKLVEK